MSQMRAVLDRAKRDIAIAPPEQHGQLLGQMIAGISALADGSPQSDWDDIREDVRALTRQVASTAPPVQLLKAELEEAEGGIDFDAYKWKELSSMAKREFLYGHHYVRKYVSATIAPTKTGKTSLLLAEAIAMVTGRPILNIMPKDGKKLRVLYWNGEDPQDELERRVAAIAVAHGIPPKEIEDGLFLDNGREKPFTIARQSGHGIEIDEDTVDALAKFLLRKRIDVFIIDPLVSCHNVSENDNMAIDGVVKAFGRIAGRVGCAIELAHHPRKSGGGNVTIEDARGASALIAGTRDARALNRMTAEEAERSDIPEKDRSRFICIGDANSNIAPPAETATWFEIRSIHLPNGDNVGAVYPWKPPSVFATVADGDLALVRKAISAGEWRKDLRARNWAGCAIAEVLEIDLNEKSGRAKAARLLKAWLANGVLKVVRKMDSERHPRDFIETGKEA